MERKCAKCPAPAVPGKSRCLKCAERNNIVVQLQRDKAYKQRNWRCPGCDNPKPWNAFAELETAMSLDGLCSDCVAAGVQIKRCAGVCYQWRSLDCFPVSRHQHDAGRRIAMCGRCEEKNVQKALIQRSTDAGKASMKKYKQSPKGVESTKRGSKRRSQWTKEDESTCELARIHSAASRIVSGTQQTSPTFTAATGWSAEAFMLHMKAATEAGGAPMQWGDRSSFDIEHRIPKEAYDFTNMEDTRRCWSAANVSALTPTANKEKGWKIVDSECIAVGVAYYPALWGGQIPTSAQKSALYTKFRSPNMLSTD